MVPVIRDAGRMSFTEFLDAYNALVDKARTNTLTADDLSGGNLSLTNPGGLGTVASVPRLMAGQGTIVATGSIGYPPGLERVGATIGAEKVMTMTSTYDHRIIQGAESGRFLARIEAYLHGEGGFYERVFARSGRGPAHPGHASPVEPSPPPRPRRALRRPPHPTRRCWPPYRPPRPCSRLIGRTATWRPSSTHWAASRRATRRWTRSLSA